LSVTKWISVCAQVLKDVDYLQSKVKIVHNATNIILGPPTAPLEHCTSVGPTAVGIYQIVKPGVFWPVRAWFLEITFVCDVCMRTCVCVSAPEAINN